ncbi:uncharacterized protein LOC125190474 isoform X1 [Salvia hispanica]|uniref:uncharacterized protein LOC125190474 isoform X1 n=1 Tax=Salvia hispanica TaxID=49212 RepID=UPI002009A52C|nr:uncharacterized protein LOC125190474 isoform X1 [Salvia hispanica]
MLNHWSHQHPLSLVVIHSLHSCDGCYGKFRTADKGFRCIQRCRQEVLLHQECAEAPRKITRAMHPQHTLTQQYTHLHWQSCCSICQCYLERISYRCTSAECTFTVHVRCSQGSDMIYGAEDDVCSIIHHPSHPNHELKLLRRFCTFKCDACSTTHVKGSSYTCTAPACQYLIHERCASLPHIVHSEDHHHSLTLSFSMSRFNISYITTVVRCAENIPISKYWIYHCELCRYAVHLTCAFTKSPHTTREKGIMEFPINDVAVGEDLFGVFLIRQGVEAYTHSIILDHQDDVDYEFYHHKLTLVSSSSSFQEQKEENSDYDDDEEDYSCRKSELICNGCNTPIPLKQTSSSSLHHLLLRVVVVKITTTTT